MLPAVLPAGTHPTPGRIEVDGHQIAYVRAGRGPPLLLIHGITTYSFIWRRVLPHLAAHHDAIAVDLLGCGDSDKPLSESYALRDHAARLVRFLDALDLPQVHVVGHDLGGGMAQILAVRYPQRVRTIALLNTVAYDFWPVQPIVALRTPILRELMMAVVDLGAMRYIVQRGLYHADRADAELLGLFMKPLQTPEGRKAFLHFARCLDNRDLTSLAADLPRLTLPALIVRGDADPYLSATIAERLQAAIPGSRLEHIPTASHFLQEDEPHQVSSLLLRFLSSAHE